MAINFPDTPTINQIFTAVGLSWKWDSIKWIVSGNALPTVGGPSTGSQTIPTGFQGLWRVENNTSLPITITLPATPTAGQQVSVKDTSGNAGLYNVTVSGGAQLIEGTATKIININWGWLPLTHNGIQWVQV